MRAAFTAPKNAVKEEHRKTMQSTMPARAGYASLVAVDSLVVRVVDQKKKRRLNGRKRYFLLAAVLSSEEAFISAMKLSTK